MFCIKSIAERSHDPRVLCHEIYLYKYFKILFMLLCIWRTSTACIRFVYEWQYRVLCNKELKGSTLNKKPSKVNITPTNMTGIKARLGKTYFFILFQTLNYDNHLKNFEWLQNSFFELPNTLGSLLN